MNSDTDTAARLQQEARSLGWALSAEQAGRLTSYADAVAAENRHLNLTRVAAPEEVWRRHLLDSLAFGLHADPARRDGVFADLGTGGGFPGVVAAIACPEAKVFLIEGKKKKLDAVARCVRRVGIVNVTCLRGRFSELAGAKDSPLSRRCDLVMARAVAPLGELVREAAPALAAGGALLCWKSDALADDERAEGDRRARARDLIVLDDLPYVSYAAARLVRYGRPEPRDA